MSLPELVRVTNMSDIDEAIDWRGSAISCQGCAHQDLLAAERCRLKHACIHDRYARRIDRFLNWNPTLANEYLGHPHFEVRAIAAKFADIFRLPRLLDDPEETVRWNALLRLPYRYLLALRNDPHREVRIRIAGRLKPTDLPAMIEDADYYVRLVVARRIDPALLAWMISDPEAQVRRMVAKRINDGLVFRLATDPDGAVRLQAVQRLPTERLMQLRHDADWRVRYEIATRIDVADLPSFPDDPDPIVQDVIDRRREGRWTNDMALEIAG